VHKVFKGSQVLRVQLEHKALMELMAPKVQQVHKAQQVLKAQLELKAPQVHKAH
jgi:hypothetical protein